MKRSASELARQILEDGSDLDPTRFELLRRYVDAIDWSFVPEGMRHYERQLARLLLHALRGTPIDQVDIDALDRLASEAMGSPGRQAKLRTAVSRLRRMLRESGELPSSGDIRDSRLREAALAELDGESRRILARWLDDRTGSLAMHQLAREATHLVSLERLLAAEPDPDESLIEPWVVGLVRQVVDCGHRFDAHNDPSRCRFCDATPKSHGLRPSPDPRKQRELRQVGFRYFKARRRFIDEETGPAGGDVPARDDQPDAHVLPA